MIKIFINEFYRIFKGRASIILAIVLSTFSGLTFLKTLSEPQPNFVENMRKIKWYLNESLTTAQTERKEVEKNGTERDKIAKRISEETMEQQVEIWTTFEKDWDEYQNGKSSEWMINQSYLKTLIKIELLNSVLSGVMKKGDVDLATHYAKTLNWLDIKIPDYEIFSEYMENISNSEIRHLSYLNQKVEIEKMIQDLERGYPLATAPSQGPGLYMRNYFASMNLSGFLLPTIIIAYFLMNALELYRSRSIFYSRSLSISPLQFWWIQMATTVCVALLIFLITFLIGFMASGFYFGWTDLQALVPMDPALWKTELVAQPTFASAIMNAPFFGSTVIGGFYYPGSITWIPCWQWAWIVIILEIWLIGLQGLTVFSLSFLFRQSLCLSLVCLWLIILCVVRFRFSLLNLLPLFWPSVVDILYGGFGIGWAIWIISSIIYGFMVFTLDLLFIGRKDIR